MSRYPDCESCAFHQVEDWVCENCEDADQWEPDNTDMGFSASHRVVQKIVKKQKVLEAA